MIKAKITSVAHYVPEKILTNFDLEKMVETNNEWIIKRTGIKERHIANKNELPSDMGMIAAKKALENAKISPNEIDLIICATITSDYITPATACIVQNKLQAKNAFAFDISAACSGFIYGLDIAEKFIISGKANNILLIAVEKLSSIVDWEDRYTCVLFGDGAGAVIIQVSDDESGIINSKLETDGNLYDYLIIPGGGSYKKPSIETINNKENFLKMNGNEVFKFAVNKMSESIEKIINLSNLNKNEIDMIFTHQANIRIIEAIQKKLDLPINKFFINLPKYGNTSAATIPIALSEAFENNLLKKGDKIILSSFGGGITWGSISLIW